MKVIVKPNGLVVAKGTDIYQVDNGIYCDGVIYGEQELSIVETEQTVIPQKTLLIDGVVSENPDYVEYKSPAQEVAELKERQILMQQAIDDLILNGGAL